MLEQGFKEDSCFEEALFRFRVKGIFREARCSKEPISCHFVLTQCLQNEHLFLALGMVFYLGCSYQAVEYKLLASLNVLNVVQSFIIFAGMASGLTVCARASCPHRFSGAPLSWCHLWTWPCFGICCSLVFPKGLTLVEIGVCRVMNAFFFFFFLGEWVSSCAPALEGLGV
jgi:hypothetical protein